MKKFLLCCLLLVSLFPIHASAESTWTKIGLTGGNISDMESFPSNPDIMLACVAGHGIYRSTDRGDYWVQVIPDVCYDISISEDDVAFVGGIPGVLVSHDLGETWTVSHDAPAGRVVAHRDGKVVAQNGGAHGLWSLSYDNGETWDVWVGTEMTHSIFFHSDDSVYWSGRNNTTDYYFVVKRAEPDNWNEWGQVKNFYGDFNPSLFFAFSDGDTAVYAFSEYRDNHPGTDQSGGIWRSTDDGVIWDRLTGYDFSATALERYENTLIIACYGNLSYAPMDVSYSTQFGSFSADITAIDVRLFGDGETIVATKGGIYKTVDGGITWNKSDNGIMHDSVGSVQVVSLDEASERIIYATKQNGILYSDDGETWTTSNLNISLIPGLLKASPNNPKRMYAGSKYIYMSDDYGTTWEVIPDIPFQYYGYESSTYDLEINPIDSNNIAIHYNPRCLDIVGGVDFVEGHYSNEWTWKTSDTRNFSYRPQFSENGLLLWRYHRTTTSLLSAYDDTNQIVHDVSLPEGEASQIWRINDSFCYVFNELNDHFVFSEDLGGTWQTTELILNNYQYASWNWPSLLGEIVLSPDKSTIFLLYPGNGIIASTDDGETWGHFDDGIDTELVYQIAFSSSDPSVMYAATESGLFRCNTPVVITDVISSVEEDSRQVAYPVLQSYPNPFNPTTTITYTLPAPSLVMLSIYSVTGQKVVTLVDGPMTAGAHAVQFDGTGLASGVYFARLEADGAVETRKMLLVK